MHIALFGRRGRSPPLLLELASPSGGELQRIRLIRVVEVVHVTPVRRRGHVTSQGLDERLDRGHLAAARRPAT